MAPSENGKNTGKKREGESEDGEKRKKKKKDCYLYSKYSALSPLLAHSR